MELSTGKVENLRHVEGNMSTTGTKIMRNTSFRTVILLQFMQRPSFPSMKNSVEIMN